MRDGISIRVSVDAKFDGKDYPVSGSPIADTISYTRVDHLTIHGTAKRAGNITLVEAVSVSDDCSTLTMKYSIRGRDGQETSGIAVFKKEPTLLADF